jgi:PAS domain S-box-containing protein
MTTQLPGTLPAGRTLRSVQAVALLLVAAFSVTTIPGIRPTPGFHTLLDGWLQGSAYVVLAVVAVLRPVTTPANRMLWSLVSGAVVLRALGFVIFLSIVRTLRPQPSPSAADAAWLAMSVVLLVALWMLVRVRVRRHSTGLTFDALLAGLTVAGVAVALLFRTLERITELPDPDERVATTLAYPLLDVALLVLVSGALVAAGWRSRSTLLLALGVVGFAVVDAVFAYQTTAGTYRPGTPLAALSLVATAGIAFSGWVSEADLEVTGGRVFSHVAIPATLGLVSVAALLYGAVEQVPLAAIVLPALALVVGIGRAVFTVLRERGWAQTMIRAQHEELLRFQALVETSDDFIAMASPGGTVLYLNPAGRRLVGLDPGRDLSEMTIADFLTPEGLRASVEVEQPAVVAHGRWQGESTLRHLAGGPPIPVAISSFLMRHPETGEPFALATVQRDISERLEAQTSLEHLADERQRLLGRLVQAQEDERARIAADVHDDSVQALAAVDLRLGMLRRQLDVRAPDLAATAATLHGSVTLGIERLRHLLFDLESPAVENDLARALEVAAEHVFEGHPPCRITGDTDLDLPEKLRVAAYRIAREAMVNVVKHADAHEVVVDLRLVDAGLEVTVDDDGRGLDPGDTAPRPGHLGIRGMQDRAAVAGGHLSLERREVGGTRVRLWLPTPATSGGDRTNGAEGPV